MDFATKQTITIGGTDKKTKGGNDMTNVRVEQYKNRPNGMLYRNVRFFVYGGVVEVEDILTTSDEKALEKARKMIKEASKL